jgi:7-cyano-7-deazaguanine synthase
MQIVAPSIIVASAPLVDQLADNPNLPGRNALLLIKAAIWCQLHGIRQLALAPLGSSPFEDAGPAFFRDFQSAINRGAPAIEILRPFGQMHKNDVMQLGRGMPLELTFSCISPKNGPAKLPVHCGECNKCAERQTAFATAGLPDRTPYANACPVG